MRNKQSIQHIEVKAKKHYVNLGCTLYTSSSLRARITHLPPDYWDDDAKEALSKDIKIFTHNDERDDIYEVYKAALTQKLFLSIWKQ